MKNLFIISILLLFSCSVDEVELENSFPDKITITNLHQSLGIDVSVKNGRTAAIADQSSVSVIRKTGSSYTVQTFMPIPVQLNVDFSSWGRSFDDANVYIFTNVYVDDAGYVNEGFSTITSGDVLELKGDSYSGSIELGYVNTTFDNISMNIASSRMQFTKTHQDWSAVLPENVPDQIEITIGNCFHNTYDAGISFASNCATNQTITYVYDISSLDNSIDKEVISFPGYFDMYQIRYLKSSVELSSTVSTSTWTLNSEERSILELPNY